MVLGGWHPSLLPDQTLAADFVDVVVIGQGEEALLDVVRHIEARRVCPGAFAGVGYKDRTAAYVQSRARRCAR